MLWRCRVLVVDGTKASRSCDQRCRPEAGAADQNDDDRDDRRHDSIRARLWRRRRIPCADGLCGDRRALLCSTVLSLVSVPAVFLVMDNVSWFMGRLGSRFISKSEPLVHKDGSSLPAGH
jgi:hypothetical protein